MISIDRLAERQRRRAAVRDIVLHLTLLAIIAICVFTLTVMLLLPRAASGSAVCLTKHEARELWPRRHIYWYGPHHCWSNRRGPPTGIKVDPVRNSMAESLSAPPVKDAGKSADKADRADVKRTIRPTIFYPPLNMRGSVPPEMLRAYAATQWPLLLDVDEEDDPELGVTKDGCCWPKLKDLISQRTKPLQNHLENVK